MANFAQISAAATFVTEISRKITVYWKFKPCSASSANRFVIKV